MNINRIAEKLAASKSTREHIRCVQCCRVGAGGEEEFLCSVRDRIKPLWLRRGQCENAEVIEKFQRERRRLATAQPLKHSIQSVLESSPSTSTAAMSSATFVREKTSSSNASTSASEEEEELICLDAKLSNADGALVYTFQRANGESFSLPSDEVYSKGKAYVKKAISTMFKKYYNTTVEFNPVMGVILTPSPTMKDITAEMFLNSQKEWKERVGKEKPQENGNVEAQNESGFEEMEPKPEPIVEDPKPEGTLNESAKSNNSQESVCITESNSADLSTNSKSNIPEIVISSEAESGEADTSPVKSRSPTILQPADSQPDEFKIEPSEPIESQTAESMPSLQTSVLPDETDIKPVLTDEITVVPSVASVSVGTDAIPPADLANAQEEVNSETSGSHVSESDFSNADVDESASSVESVASEIPAQPAEQLDTSIPNPTSAQEAEAQDDTQIAEAVDAKPKRKVGRPRNDERPSPPPVSSEEERPVREQRRSKLDARKRLSEGKAKTPTTEPTIRRKVGRPRKSAPVESTEPSPKKRSGRPRKNPLPVGAQIKYGKTGRPTKEAVAKMKRLEAQKEKLEEKLGSGTFTLDTLPADLLRSPKKKAKNEVKVKEELEEMSGTDEESDSSENSQNEESQNSTRFRSLKMRPTVEPIEPSVSQSKSMSPPKKVTTRRSNVVKSASPEKPSPTPPKAATSAEPPAKRRRLH